MKESDLIGIIQTLWNLFLAGISFLILWQTLILEKIATSQLASKRKEFEIKLQKMRNIRKILLIIFISGYIILTIYLI